MDVSYSIAFLMGLTGSLHCAGMCGPIVLAIPFENNKLKLLAIFLYQAGRIMMYSLMGLILFSFKQVFNPAIQQIVSILIGSLLLLFSILYLIPKLAIVSNIKFPWHQWVLRQLGKVFQAPSLSMISLAGLLNGLLPCGLVYMALSMSMSVTTNYQMAFMMLSFGAGTLPMMIGIAFFKDKIHWIKNYKLQRLIPMFIVAYGLLFILRGANLGIPYISPKVHMEQSNQHEIKIKHSCCHKQ